MSNLPAPTDTRGIPLKSGGAIEAIVPSDVEQAYRMAKMIHASGMAPRDMNSPEKIITAILHGMEVGLKPMAAVQSIAVVNGRPTLWGDAMLGLVLGSGLVEDFKEWIEGEGDKRTARFRIKRAGVSAPIEQKFSVADAKAAGLWGKQGPWKQYPDRMLQMRARGFGLRDSFADVLKGLYLAEEVRDYTASARVVGEAHVSDAPVNASALLEQARAEPDDDSEAAVERADADLAHAHQEDPEASEPLHAAYGDDGDEPRDLLGDPIREDWRVAFDGTEAEYLGELSAGIARAIEAGALKQFEADNAPEWATIRDDDVGDPKLWKEVEKLRDAARKEARA